MGRYRVTPGSSDFNSKSHKLVKLSSENLTLLETLLYRAKHNAITLSDADKLKSLVRNLGYKKENLIEDHRSKLKRTQSAVSAALARKADKARQQTLQEKEKQAKAKPTVDGLPPLSENFYRLSVMSQKSVLEQREKIRKSRLTPERFAHEAVGDAIAALKNMPNEMKRMLEGYKPLHSYRWRRGSPADALEVLLKQLPKAAEAAIEAARKYDADFGPYNKKSLSNVENMIEAQRKELYASMKETLLPHLDEKQRIRIVVSEPLPQTQPDFYGSSASAKDIKVPPPRMR